mgnify:CR=1 FL=1
MLIRLRTKEGLERVEVAQHSTVSHLKEQIGKQLQIPPHQQVLSLRQELLLAKANVHDFRDLADDGAALSVRAQYRNRNDNWLWAARSSC